MNPAYIIRAKLVARLWMRKYFSWN